MPVLLEIVGLPKGAPGLGALRMSLEQTIGSLGLGEVDVHFATDMEPVEVCKSLVVKWEFFRPCSNMTSERMSALQDLVFVQMTEYCSANSSLFLPSVSMRHVVSTTLRERIIIISP
jgi:hypothetical protein